MFENDQKLCIQCFDTMLEGICIIDQSGKIIRNNKSFEEIFGFDRDELIDQSIDILIPIESRKLHQEHLRNFYKSPVTFKKRQGREFRALKKDGSSVYVEIGLNQLEFNGNVYTKTSVTDISNRKQKEFEIVGLNRELKGAVAKQTLELRKLVSELQKSNKALVKEVKQKELAEIQAKQALKKEKELHLLQTKFLSMVSHEFKTPLSGMLTSISLIKKYTENLNQAPLDKHIETINRLIFQLNNVLNDFLFLEKSDSYKMVYTKLEFDICELIHEANQDLENILKSGQYIEFECPEKEIIIYQDRTIVDFIYRNLLSNAIKYSEENNKIEVALWTDNELHLEIIDSGIGIPKPEQKHLFERFFRASNALFLQGSGIGLNMVKHHLEEIGGKISFESEEHKGSRFTIQIPCGR
ncbi:PAS domain-containing sensor histidine kinase [Namhaeicola litoreus]|uniref:histidine kinase n=1 Tax=Namhaeicola litoreus TaxID=1052145 RepID=A0ABW3Y060_9FLAO